MPEISIADFTDYVLKTGQAKITKVTQLYNRPIYHPATDFWKPLRDGICDYHEGKISTLDFPSLGASNKKEPKYSEAIRGYQKFLRATKSEWFKPHRGEWKFEDLKVRINPEVGFNIGGRPVLVKLYFKAEALSKPRIQVALSLMSAGQKDKSFVTAILDVPRSRLHEAGPLNPQMTALLKGEATAFLGIWNSLAALRE